MATVTKPLALNESLNSTENTPRNIADVLADELDGIKQAINSQSGSGNGHIIQNSSGANMPSENTMQFVDAHLSDDSVGGKTKVETFKAVTQVEYSSETEDGAYIITDGDGATIGPASEDYVEVDVTTSMTYGDALALLFNDVDLTKVTENSYINMLGFVFYLTNNETGNYDFTSLNGNSSKAEMFVINNYNNALKYYVYNLYTQQRTDKSSDNIWTNGKIKLYYGNKKAIVDLQTTANRCLMTDGTTVQDRFTKEVGIAVSDVFTPASGITFGSNSKVIKKNGKIYARLYGSGSITTNPNGSYTFATINSAYRPFAYQICAIAVNSATSGQTFDSASCFVGTGGSVGIITGQSSKQYGNASYPWTTSDGITITWDL